MILKWAKFAILLAAILIGFDPAFADPKLSGILVVSDFHLYDRDYDFNTIADPVLRERERLKAGQNEKAFRKMMKVMTEENGITDILMNGDLFHAPTLAGLNPDVRIGRMVEILLQMESEAGKPIYFTLGNHDVLMNFVGGDLIPVPGFAEKFKTALDMAKSEKQHLTGRKPAIYLTGANDPRLGDYTAVFDLEIRGRKMKVSHAPFVSTDEIEVQASSFKTMNPRAYSKVTEAHRLTENKEGILYIQSDSHTPAADPKLNVFNSGMLTVDESMPFKQPTFVVISKDNALHYSFDRNSLGTLSTSVRPYKIPNCSRLLFSP